MQIQSILQLSIARYCMLVIVPTGYQNLSDGVGLDKDITRATICFKCQNLAVVCFHQCSCGPYHACIIIIWIVQQLRRFVYGLYSN